MIYNMCLERNPWKIGHIYNLTMIVINETVFFVGILTKLIGAKSCEDDTYTLEVETFQLHYSHDGRSDPVPFIRFPLKHDIQFQWSQKAPRQYDTESDQQKGDQKGS